MQEIADSMDMVKKLAGILGIVSRTMIEAGDFKKVIEDFGDKRLKY